MNTMTQVPQEAPDGAAHMHNEQGSFAGRVGHFLWHLVQMVLAMLVGMAVFGGVRALLDPTGFLAVLRDHLDVSYLAMAVFMAAPMVAWMRFRGHSWERAAEMAGAMIVPIAAACLLWRFGVAGLVPALSDEALGTVSHIAMYVGMLLAMVYRFGEYAHAGHHVPHGHPTPGDRIGDGGM